MSCGAGLSERPGVPVFVSGIDSKDTPDDPLGVTFAGRAWREHKLLRLAYAFEQASRIRNPPPGLSDEKNRR